MKKMTKAMIVIVIIFALMMPIAIRSYTERGDPGDLIISFAFLILAPIITYYYHKIIKDKIKEKFDAATTPTSTDVEQVYQQYRRHYQQRQGVTVTPEPKRQAGKYRSPSIAGHSSINEHTVAESSYTAEDLKRDMDEYIKERGHVDAAREKLLLKHLSNPKANPLPSKLTEADMLFLSLASKQGGRVDTRENPASERTFEEHELSHIFFEWFTSTISSYEDKILDTRRSIGAVSKDFIRNAPSTRLKNTIQRCQNHIDAYNAFRNYCYASGPGARIYFQDTWEYRQNIHSPCFSYVDDIIELKKDLEKSLAAHQTPQSWRESADDKEREKYFRRTVSKIQVQDAERIINDCINLMMGTNNVETFLMRWDLGIEKTQFLYECQKYGIYRGKPDPKEFADLLLDDEWIKDIIDRTYEDTVEKAKKLKAEKGRQKRIDTYFEKFEPYSHIISPQLAWYIKELKNKNPF